MLSPCVAQAVLPGYLPPVSGRIASDSDLYPVRTNQTLNECSDWCSATPSCISFNYCGGACGIQGWSISYNPETAPGCAWYRRSIPRNDAPAPRGVPWVLDIPAPGTVSLRGGPISDAFTGNLVDYVKLRDPVDMLFWFASRAGNANPPGQCFGWDGWIKGSATGNFLMGAGSALQWTDDADLRASVQTVVEGIRKFQDNTTGWLWAFKESDLFDNADNLPDYCAGWVTRGLIDAASAGIPDALQLARDSLSLFNNHSSLPWILPQNGGPNPVKPYPAGFNNVTVGGYGQSSGHMIYIEYQGMIKHTLMALTSMGTQADVDIVAQQYQEDWWLEALLAKDAYHAIWHRQFFSHNYEVTAFEAFLDMYVLTGNATYLSATLNAWELLREHWILPGGSFSLNEGSYYPPDSYYIGFVGTHVAGTHKHAAAAEAPPLHDAQNASDPYYHAPCMYKPGPILSAASRQPGLNQQSSDPPTGELCGNVFWALFNQRFHRLFPDNDTFVEEIERSILNVGIAALGREGSGGEGPGGRGIRYFANQHKVKQLPSMHASCCEGQGTRLFGTLPAFLFSLQKPTPAVPQATVRVDIYAEAALTAVPLPTACGAGSGLLEVHTQWPYGSSVAVNFTLPSVCSGLTLGLRMPAWATGPIGVSLNGAPAGTGTPGVYFYYTPPSSWPAGSSVFTFQLGMALQSALYLGFTQIAPFKRYSFLFGPILMSAQGPWDAPSDSLIMPAGVDPTNPATFLLPSGDGNALHFNVSGAPGFTFKPYWEVQGVSSLQSY